jgi:hypothetical protein
MEREQVCLKRAIDPDLTPRACRNRAQQRSFELRRADHDSGSKQRN